MDTNRNSMRCELLQNNSYITLGVFNGTVGRHIFTQMPLSVTVGARALSLSSAWFERAPKSRERDGSNSGHSGTAVETRAASLLLCTTYNPESEGSRA